MANEFIRIWIEEDVVELSKKLLIVGESFSDCGNCRHLGLDFARAKSCPECKVEFRYITSRHAGGGAAERFRWLRKIREKRPDLKCIDYDDYERNMARIRARNIFK